MAISTVTNRVGYQGDGTSAVFAFPYRFHALTDLGVFVYNSSVVVGSVINPLVLNAAGGLGYTISATQAAGGIYPNGGSVIFNSSPSAQAVVVIFRSSVVTNSFIVGQNGAIPSVGLNNEIDYLTIISQRLQDQTTRSVRLPDGFFGTFDTSLPPVMRAESVVIANSTATGFAMGPTASEIANANSSALLSLAYSVAAGVSAGAAAASAALANSAAVSVGNNLVLVNSAVASVGNAVALIGSTAFWGVEAQSSALSATNQAVLAGSAAVSAGAQAAIATAQTILAGSAAVSASDQAVLSGSAALSASNSAALLNPLIPKMTIYNSGAGTHTLTLGVKYYKIRIVGGGGGGAGGGTAGSSGFKGGFTTFGSAYIHADGGDPGGWAGSTAGGAGGSSFIIATSLVGFGFTGGCGAGANGGNLGAFMSGGNGGTSPFGGHGGGSGARDAYPNTGGGGAGGITAATGSPGCGGGSGGYVEVIVGFFTGSTFAYIIGDGGRAGGGTSIGGRGGTGKVIVEEFFNS